MTIVLFRLVTSSLLPVLLSAVFYLAEKRSGFGKLPYKVRQTIIGVCFGGLAVLSTEFGIPVEGAVINVRDAAPLTASLIFGAPAGIIAGIIGGVERWFAALWGAGEFSRLACTLATILAGFIGAGVRCFLLDDKRPTWFYGLAVGVATEVLHMVMIFLIASADTQQAFAVVKACAAPMIAANGASVMAAAFVVSRLGREKVRRSRAPETTKISQTFQLWLLVCVVIAFICTSIFTYSMQTNVADTNTDELLLTNAQDVRSDIKDASDANMLALTRKIAAQLPIVVDGATLRGIAQVHDVTEINLVNEGGIIYESTHPEFVGYVMSSGEQSAAFMPLITDGVTEIVQDYQPTSYDASVYRKYAGIALEDGGFLQVGYDAELFQLDIAEQVKNAAKNRHIGNSGSVIICDTQGIIVSDRDGHEGESISLIGYDGEEFEEGVRFEAEIFGEPSYCVYTVAEGYRIISVLPKSEAMFTRDMAVYLLLFMEIIVFAALFATIAFLVKKVVVDNIRKINSSLAQITGGNLNVKVNVRTNEEFASLSDDINSTVVTLKHYIDEAAARIDRELEFARQIQRSALPSVFPPYPHRRDFAIYASMDPAKEVGGDFYDFYLLGEDRLAFLAADVSGKGIPAAMFMMTAKTLIKGFAESGMEVDEVFTRANEKLCEGNEAGMFVTAWMGILDLKTGLLTYANAGHNPPAVRHKDGEFEFLRTRPNFILAGMDGVKYRRNELQLQRGDEIYLYTDGVTEAQDVGHNLFGDDRLLASLNEKRGLDVERICKKVKEDVDSFVGGFDQFDDITMVCVKLNELPEPAKLAVKPDMESMARVADFLEEQLEKLEVPVKTSRRLLIALDEIYSNIVRYSGADSAEVSCGADGGVLTLTFADNGKPYNPLDAEEPDVTLSAEERGVGGLGIFMVRRMMDDVDYKYIDGRNVLTLTLSVR